MATASTSTTNTSAPPPSPLPNEADVFDVAAEREAKRALQEDYWSKRLWSAKKGTKRSATHADLIDQLSDALDERDPSAANHKFALLETALKKRKLAASKAASSRLAEQARRVFGTTEQYTIICADPPWKYPGAPNHKLGTERHYDTMSFEELAALPVGGLAAPDAVLILWTTFIKLEEATSLCAAWGFEYTTVFTVWVKVDRAGNPLFSMGDYTMPCAEFALLAIRGSMQIKQRKEIINSVIRARPNGHSRKPPAVLDQIVRVFGDFRRINLFTRTPTAGWDGWGNQSAMFTNDLVSDADKADETAYVPRQIDRRKQTSDRVYRFAVNGGAQTFAQVTVATSHGRLYAEFDAETQRPFAVKAADEEHDHDGTRLCCRPAGDLVPDNVLSMISMVDSYLLERGGYSTVRNSLYTHLSEQTVRDHVEHIKQRQRHNGDMLYAINYNKQHRPLVRVAAPSLELHRADDDNQ